MKKNIVLSLILLVLIVFTYFYQELGSQRKQQEFDLKNRIVGFDPQTLDEIELTRTKLIKVRGQWMVGALDYPASEEVVQKLLGHILNIYQIKQLESKDQNQYFSNQSHFISFSSIGRKWQYRLGDASETTGNFYFQDLNLPTPVTFLSRDISEYSGIYRTELELMLNKYLELKDMIAAAPEAFIDRNLFRDVELGKLKRLKIDNKWNRWFELDLEKNSTDPLPPNGIQYLKFGPTIASLIENARVKFLHQEADPLLDTLICEIEATDQNSSHQYQVYGEYKGRKGIFAVKQGDNKRVFELGNEAKALLFSNAQSFWDKRIFYADDLKGLKKFDFKLGDEKEMYDFSVSDVEEFQITITDKRVKEINRSHTNFLFHLFFSLTQFQQAKSVLESVPDDAPIKLTLKAELLGKQLEVAFSDVKLFLVNKSDNYVLEYLFPVAEYNFKNLNDFFALK